MTISTTAIASDDEIRAMFAAALSEMYRSEVPQYGTLLELVSDINMQNGPWISQGDQHRMEVERHGAIRLGTAEELAMMRRLFVVMGMHPVGYYDLTVAGLPVHATCFRPLSPESLARNPFRVFTSLLCLESVANESLRGIVEDILSKRQIFTPRCLGMIAEFESGQRFTKAQATEFITEALETFCWHKTSTVDIKTYNLLHQAHPLLADVVCFRGPHINHLTPRTFDIEAAQNEMSQRGLQKKTEIEGPPPRQCPILLRQTSFLALEEKISFSAGAELGGRHKARFGEIEQRGVALTPKGRKLYDDLMTRFRIAVAQQGPSLSTDVKQNLLIEIFRAFPDSWATLRREKLSYFSYSVANACVGMDISDVDNMVESGILAFEPITYEDFLPVSAAGIFTSNLGTGCIRETGEVNDQASFEEALGCAVLNGCDLYSAMERNSITACLRGLHDSI